MISNKNFYLQDLPLFLKTPFIKNSNLWNWSASQFSKLFKNVYLQLTFYFENVHKNSHALNKAFREDANNTPMEIRFWWNKLLHGLEIKSTTGRSKISVNNVQICIILIKFFTKIHKSRTHLLHKTGVSKVMWACSFIRKVLHCMYFLIHNFLISFRGHFL